jgi:hypothetical protein
VPVAAAVAEPELIGRKPEEEAEEAEEGAEEPKAKEKKAE